MRSTVHNLSDHASQTINGKWDTKSRVELQSLKFRAN